MQKDFLKSAAFNDLFLKGQRGRDEADERDVGSHQEGAHQAEEGKEI